MRYAWESQVKTKILSPSQKSEGKIFEDEQIVYVPMRLQRTQISDGSIIYCRVVDGAGACLKEPDASLELFTSVEISRLNVLPIGNEVGV